MDNRVRTHCDLCGEQLRSQPIPHGERDPFGRPVPRFHQDGTPVTREVCANASCERACEARGWHRLKWRVFWSVCRDCGYVDDHYSPS